MLNHFLIFLGTHGGKSDHNHHKKIPQPSQTNMRSHDWYWILVQKDGMGIANKCREWEKGREVPVGTSLFDGTARRQFNNDRDFFTTGPYKKPQKRTLQ
jgi:hypothetical protein